MDPRELDPFGAAFLSDPYAHFRRLRDESPVHHVESRKMWILSRYDDVAAAARNPAVFSSTGGVGYDWNQRPMMPMYDPPEHTRMRRMVAKPFTPVALAAFRPRVEKLVDELVARALDARSVDVVADLALPLSLGTIAELLGVPTHARKLLRRWSQGTVADLAGGLVGAEARRVDELRREFNVFLRALIQERRAELAHGRPPSVDVISMLVAAKEEEKLTDQELVAFCVLLMVAGFETTVNGIANGVLALLAHPGELRKLCENPEKLVAPMVEESVRYDGPVLTFFRNTLSDVTMHDVTIPKGSKVMLAFASGNRDERRFPDPDVFRVDRNPSEHLAFGTGIHFCLGAPLARMQMTLLAKSLLKSFSKIEQDGEAVRTASVLFRGVKTLPVHLTPRDAGRAVSRTTIDWLDAPAEAKRFEAKPMRIAVAGDELEDLRARLSRTRFPTQVDHAGWDYGAELGFMRDLVTYWRETFDWRAAEARLNEFQHFVADVREESIHFVHARAKDAKKTTPLLLVHGWPGPFTELWRLLPRLTTPDASGAAFDVVLASLPGFPLSPAPKKRGVGCVVTADLYAELMTGLGYDRFGVVGTDLGAGVASRMGLVHRDRVSGIHLSFPHEDPPAGEFASLTAEERTWLSHMRRVRDRELTHTPIHSRTPQTLAYSLVDSPVGLAAWLVARYRSWSDCDGDVEARFSKDDLLTNVMLYWIGGAGGSAIRYYFESRETRWALGAGERIEAPTAIALGKKELVQPPRRWIERVYNLVRLTHLERGGHFTAWEEPDAYAADVRAFFQEIER